MHAPGKHGHVPLLVPYQWPSPRTGPHPLPTAQGPGPRLAALARPSPLTGPHPARPSHRPAPAAHGPPGQARAPTRRTATLPQHAQDSQAQYGSTSGCFRRIHSARRSRPQIALARLGPAPLTRITHGPNWGNPFVTQIIDLSHGVKGYSYKWVARLTRLQEPPSPSRSEATARFRPGSRMQIPGGTHAELLNKDSTLRCVSPHAMRNAS
jgi:hypothetical protein